MRRARLINVLLASALVVGFASLSGATTRFDPALRFRALRTEHFVLYFHQGEERQAQRLAVIAEETWRTLQRPLGVQPPPLTHVVLADQSEKANGYATPLPYDTIVIYTVWPSGSEYDFADWLRLAFTHELTHIVHLDPSEGWASVARSIFGRAPYAFPNLFLPTWQIEGIATYEESAITGEGRLYAGDFRAIVDEAARARSLEPLDRVNGGLTDWPGGAAVYAYGVRFHEYLAERFGAESLARLARATARRIPYFSAGAFHRVYGESLRALWRDYQAALISAVISSEPIDAAATRLTRQGFSISGPRFDRFACDGCPPSILYSAANPNGFPAIYRVGFDGSIPRRVTTRYLGSTTAIGRETIFFDQTEQRRNVGAYSDLYAFSRGDGHVRQITSEARLRDPDLSPNGETLVCVQARPGQRDLVTVWLTASAKATAVRRSVSRRRKADTTGKPVIAALVSEPDVYFDAPKWSPDGRSIAVERHRLGAMPEIVIVDAATKAIRVVAAADRTRFAMPAWRPDGRALVVAVAPEDQTFNLFEVALDGSSMRQLTHASGGATWPDVSPDGKTIAFVGYTTDGYDVFMMPYPERDATPPRTAIVDSAASAPAALRRAEERVDLQPPHGATLPGSPAVPTFDYSPLATLRPTSWTPVIEIDSDQTRVGAAIGGVDVLGYHSYALSATWRVSSPSGVTAPTAASPDWQMYYLYDRWRPTFYAAASTTTSFFAGPATESGSSSAGTRREQAIEGGVVLPFRSARVFHSAQLSIARAVDEYTLPAGSLIRDRTPLRAAWETITARTYGYSISREHGIATGATAEVVRRGFGSDADATTFTGDVRGYVPGLRPHHVVAVRLSGGASTGDATVGRTFLLGGGDSADAGVVNFGSRASSLLRGFADAAFAGSHVALANVEYRWPIARPQRGIGTDPIFLHSVHAAVFADAGEAWTRAFDADALKTSVGGELSANIVAGYFAPLTLSIGAAWGHDRSGAIGDRATAYFRVGKAF